MVDELILISYHVVVLDTIELPFKLPDFDAVCVHLLTRIGLVLVELVDNKRRVSVYHEAFDAELDGYMKSMETCFIFRGIVGRWKMNLDDVSELVLSRSNKQNAGTSTIDVEGTIKIHHPMLGASSGDGLLDLGPLIDEVS